MPKGVPDPTLTTNEKSAARLRKRRQQWKEFERRAWTPEDFATLRLHIELLGSGRGNWYLIARSMRRSPDAIRNKLIRMRQEALEAARFEARAWLLELCFWLDLELPDTWDAVKPVRKTRKIYTSKAERRRDRKRPPAPAG